MRRFKPGDRVYYFASSTEYKDPTRRRIEAEVMNYSSKRVTIKIVSPEGRAFIKSVSEDNLEFHPEQDFEDGN